MIRFKDVCIDRDAQTLIKDIDLHIEEGEFVYLIGKVGSGKSSLLKSFYGECPVTTGTARVLEYDMIHLKHSQVPYLRRRLGIIFQDFQLMTDRTVAQNLDFVLKATGWKDKKEREERIREVLKLVGLETKDYRMPNTLSGGEQQRVVIARALLNKPAVILADEPTGNLDPETGHNIVQLLYDICREQHTSVVMSTHNLQLLQDFPGRVLHVVDQKLVDETPVADISASSETEDAVIIPSVPTGESPSETQSDEAPDSGDSNSVADHCSPEANQPEAPDCNGQSDQKPSE